MNEEKFIKEKIMLEIANIKQKNFMFVSIKNLIIKTLGTILESIPVVVRGLSIITLLIGFLFGYLNINSIYGVNNYVDHSIYDIHVYDHISD